MPTPEAKAGQQGARRGLRLLGRIELVVLVLAALFALGFHLTLPSRLPDESAYAELSRVLEAELQPQDAVVLFPWWAERARLFMPEGTPVHGWMHHEGEDFLPHARLWVIAQPQLPLADWSAFEQRFGPGRAQRGQTRTFGTLELRLYENGRHRPVLFSAVERVAQARVYLEGATQTPCPFDGQRHRCPGPPHLYVAPEWHELLYVPRRCLWMHPPGGRSRLVAEFPATSMGSELLLEAGVIWEHAFRTDPQLTPVQVVVEDAASGKRLTGLQLRPGVEGMQRVTLPTGSALPPEVPLRVWVQSDNPEARQVCLQVRTLGEAKRNPAGSGASTRGAPSEEAARWARLPLDTTSSGRLRSGRDVFGSTSPKPVPSKRLTSIGRSPVGAQLPASTRTTAAARGSERDAAPSPDVPFGAAERVGTASPSSGFGGSR